MSLKLVNIGAGDSLLPDGTKPLPETMMINSVRSVDIQLRAISQEMSKPSITIISWKITYLKLHWNCLGKMSQTVDFQNCIIVCVWLLLFLFWNNSIHYGNTPLSTMKQEGHIFHIEFEILSTCVYSYLAATKQLYDWFSPSVCPSVCPSVRHTFFTMFPSSYHHEIFRSYYQWRKWRQCKRSRSEVKGQGHRGQHPT